MHRGIGRYSLALALAIARNAGSHDVRIVVNSAFPDSAAALRQAFDGLVPASAFASFATPLPVVESDQSNRWRVRAAERIREHFLASLRPDLVHVASLFEGISDNSVSSVLHGESRFDSAVTLYDLIPLLRKERYLTDPNIAAWYYRKLQSLKNAELLLAISGHAREEAIGALQLAPESVVNISSAVDGIFRVRPLALQDRSALLARHNLHRPFIMYTGGIDYRKNIEGLIEAYSLLSASLRSAYQLAIICSVQDADRVRLQRLVAKLKLDAHDVVLTGYVSDDDLVSLYNCTALFVFPSLHEGFGLPALEAMACGAPVIGSNASSIPEVIGRADALFDPTSVPAMTAAMAGVLQDPDHADALRRHGLAQARLFSWDASARRAVDAFEEIHRRNAPARTTARIAGAALAQHRPRLAFISPLPPERSGIADYSAELLPELARFYDIELVLAQPTLDDPWARHNYPQRSVEWFDAHAHEFDRIVYQFGNSTFHTHMFGLLDRHPGVVFLHDFFLSGILNHIEGSSKLPNAYCRSLYLAHGYRPLVEERALGRAVSMQAYPCNKAVLDRATGVIVHSDHSRALAENWYGPGTARDWRVVPLLRKIPEQSDRTNARRALGVDDDAFLMCSFGMLAPTKCIDAILTAWIESAAGSDPRCHIVFIGDAGANNYGDGLRMRIASHPRIRITGYASITEYHAYLAAADAAVQLRNGSRGETSAAVLDCLAYGLPTIVNAHGSASEIPEVACLRLEDRFSADALRSAIDQLSGDLGLRLRLGAAARLSMKSHSPARAGALVRDAIETFARESPGTAEQRLLRSIAAIGNGDSDANRVQVAASIAANRPLAGTRTLLVDVTRLAQRDMTDSGGSPQRELIQALVAAAPANWRIEPVRHDGKRYLHARRFTLDLLGRTDLLIEDAVADAGSGDILLGIDNEAETILPPAWHARGVLLQNHTGLDGAVMSAMIVAELLAAAPLAPEDRTVKLLMHGVTV
jgi:glycosyltransferase involved in cell wall biosynthesis